MKKIVIDEKNYILEKEYKECFNQEEVNNKVTEYFFEYDYILGDYSYEKLRMKGFYASNNTKAKEINDIKNIEQYLKNYCAYNCGYFLLKKMQ